MSWGEWLLILLAPVLLVLIGLVICWNQPREVASGRFPWSAAIAGGLAALWAILWLVLEIGNRPEGGISLGTWLSIPGFRTLEVPLRFHWNSLAVGMLALLTGAAGGFLQALNRSRLEREDSRLLRIGAFGHLLAVTGLLLAGNWAILLVCWSLIPLTDLLLQWSHSSDRTELNRIRRLLLMQLAGSALLLTAVSLYWQMVRSFSFPSELTADFSAIATNTPELFSPFVTCLLGSVAIRCGWFPFWVGISGQAGEQKPEFGFVQLISRVSGLYPLWLVLPSLIGSPLGFGLTTPLMLLGLLTLIIGSCIATTQVHKAEAVNWTVIAHLGLIGCGLALMSEQGFLAAGIQILILVPTMAVLLMIPAQEPTQNPTQHPLGASSGEVPAEQRTWAFPSMIASVILVSGFWGQAQLLTALEQLPSRGGLYQSQTAAYGVRLFLLLAGMSLLALAHAHRVFRLGPGGRHSLSEKPNLFRGQLLILVLVLIIGGIAASRTLGPQDWLNLGIGLLLAALATISVAVMKRRPLLKIHPAWLLLRLALRNALFFDVVAVTLIAVPLRMLGSISSFVDTVLISPLTQRASGLVSRMIDPFAIPLEDRRVSFYLMAVVLSTGILLALLIWVGG